jgi:hypothetical protein
LTDKSTDEPSSVRISHFSCDVRTDSQEQIPVAFPEESNFCTCDNRTFCASSTRRVTRLSEENPFFFKNKNFILYNDNGHIDANHSPCLCDLSVIVS